METITDEKLREMTQKMSDELTARLNRDEEYQVLQKKISHILANENLDPAFKRIRTRKYRNRISEIIDRILDEMEPSKNG